MDRFDARQLPDSELEFVVVTDTHYVHDATGPFEFASRGRQSARIEYALGLIEDLDPAFAVHLGDLVQTFPGRRDFDAALEAALDQLQAIDVDWRFVAGNHDVGDKPDPTMPTAAVTEDSLTTYHERVGRSWYRWGDRGTQFVVINSQLLNADVPAADDHRAWIEAELAGLDADRCFLFTHLPPFLHAPDEPHRGVYDTVGEPARSWLLELVREAGVDIVFAGHTHFAFRHDLGGPELHVVPSPAFTRPGFAELFASAPPPERGRDDVGKLGFLLVRLVGGVPHLHWIPTQGIEGPPSMDEGRRVLTPTGRRSRDPRVGVSLVDAVTTTATVPAVFPSGRAHRVREDYSALSLVRAGVGHVRLDATDLDTVHGRRTIAALREAGIAVTVRVVAANPFPWGDRRESASVDGVDVMVPGKAPAWDRMTAAMSSLRDRSDVVVTASRLDPTYTVPGKQHPRFRAGWTDAELAACRDRLPATALPDRFLRWIPPEADSWTRIRDASETGRPNDWVLPLAGGPDPVSRLCLAIAAVACTSDARLWVQPLRALDRTMDPSPGLLDRHANPTPRYRALRSLVTVLCDGGGPWQVGDVSEGTDARRVLLERDTERWLLVVPDADGDPPNEPPVPTGGDRSVRDADCVLVPTTARVHDPDAVPAVPGPRGYRFSE